jgi:RNA-directed DNA polymerase
MNTTEQPVYEWKDLNWRVIEKQVYKLQKRIYQATRRGDGKAVHKLQRLLMRSWAARCLAVRKVTQDNQGKRTAGVDGAKALNPRQRLELARNLQLSQKAKPTRRVWIAKPGTAEKRPLGIPTIRNRAEQALAKLALEPEWEAKFEPSSYGFRPGRSCHDAIEDIFGEIKQKPKYALDADIAKCFDKINHQALLDKLKTMPSMRRAIRAWLKAGVIDGGTLFPTEAGTPQGGVISPLLANIALHGLEEAIAKHYPVRIGSDKKGRIEWKPKVIRFADDFVVLHPSLEVIKQVQEIASAWLADMGLELKPSKTRITHTLQEYNGNVGFDFLGFEIRQYAVGKTHTGTNSNGVPLGYKTIIKPSKEAQKRHVQAISELVRVNANSNQGTLIGKLNPIIRGWANYYSTVASGKTFARMGHATYLMLRNWAIKRHKTKPKSWIVRKYWHLTDGKWDFSSEDGKQLFNHTQTRIRRYTKVKGARSPYDGDWVYWTSRLGRHPELSTRLAKLIQRQQGKCAWCGLYLQKDDLLEVDHVLRTTMGGAHGYKNWQLIHRHCHDQKTAVDGSTVD